MLISHYVLVRELRCPHVVGGGSQQGEGSTFGTSVECDVARVLSGFQFAPAARRSVPYLAASK